MKENAHAGLFFHVGRGHIIFGSGVRSWLFEFEDMPWFPDTIRRGMVDYLSFFLRKTDFYKPIVPLLARCLERSEKRTIVDMCSGGGGPVPEVQKNLEVLIGERIPVTLTDKFPNVIAFQRLERESQGSISFYSFPVDATCIPEQLEGVRTSFSAFHHFSPDMAKAVLLDAVKRRVPIAIFDGGDKSIFTILGIVLVHPIVFLLCTPFLRPFSFGRMVFTYVLPLIPLCTVWDGAVSITRLYRPPELKRLADEIGDDSYEWEAGIKRHKLGFGISYLIGCPKLKA